MALRLLQAKLAQHAEVSCHFGASRLKQLTAASSCGLSWTTTSRSVAGTNDTVGDNSSWLSCTFAALSAAAVASSVAICATGFATGHAEAPKRKTYKKITRKEVEAHKTARSGIWVTFGEGVYDITTFVASHPGGESKIMLAAGGSLEPFWSMYAQHKQPQILEMLEGMRIGTLPMHERTQSSLDPYANEPQRVDAITVRNPAPFNGEAPLSALLTHITPTEFHFKRNHMPVPDILPEAYELQIIDEDGEVAKVLSLADLKRFPKHEVTMTLQCAGNRRSEMHAERAVKGLQWGNCAISTATWGGARLTDVLQAANVTPSPSARHLQFIGLDCDMSGEKYGASVPVGKALAAAGECLLAYEMNGEPLTRDHGFPVRAMVPGHVAARSVKWLDRIVVSDSESDSHWQQLDYKGFCPDEDWSNLDWSKAPAIQETPITSAIITPAPGSAVSSGSATLKVKGYAFAGGGREVVRVDVSADGGRTWRAATLLPPPSDLPPAGYKQKWAWTHWQVDVPVPDRKREKIELVCKAVDESYNVQPETFKPIYNARGVLSNAWHRLQVEVA